MLDTVTLREAWPLKRALPAGRRLALDNKVNIWPDYTGQAIRRIEFSAATVLHGHNGHLIETQEQLDTALAMAAESLGAVAEVPHLREWQPSRLDLAWNFDLPAGPLIMAHGALLVPGIRNGATSFKGGEGVSWRGAKSLFMVTLYDKSKKMHVPGSVLRAEVRLGGDKLHDRFADGNWMDFDVLYGSFRDIMSPIRPILKPVAVDNWKDALALEPAEIRNRFMARLGHKPARTLRRWLQNIEGGAAQVPEDFSWSGILPIEGPPVPVNVERSHRSHRR